MTNVKATRSDSRLKRFMGLAGRCLLILFASWFIGLLLLWLAFLLPGEAAQENARASLNTLENEGLHYNFGNEHDYYKQDTKLDGYTDLLIINFAANNVQSLDFSPLRRAVSPAWVVAQDQEDSYDSARLLSFITEPDSDYTYHYFRRYWTGFIVPVRILFSFFHYDEIRMMNAVAQALLAAFCCALIWKKVNWQCALAILLAYYALQPVTISKSLTFSTSYYIAFIGCAVAACRCRKRSLRAPPLLLFMLLGVCVAYFDFLTYPLATLGLPLVVCFSGKELGREALKESLLCLVKLCAAWTAGYVGMWGGKWIVAYLAGYSDVFQEALAAAAERTNGSSYSLALTLLGLETYCFTKRKIAILLLPCALGLIGSLFGLGRARCRRESAKRFAVFFCIAMLPVGWTAFALNHTSLHWFYAHRIFCVFFAAMTMSVNPYCLRERHVRESFYSPRGKNG